MNFKTAAAVFAMAASISACTTVPIGRDFSKLSAGDQLDFYTCVFSNVGSSMRPHGNSAGELLDRILSRGSTIQDTARSAASRCAIKQFINPNTIPGLR